MTLGEKILNMRKARGWSQEELADRTGVSRQAVSRWESGSAKPDADKIIAICDLFGISADYLLRDNYEGERPTGAADQKAPAQPVNIKRKILKVYAAASAAALFVMMIISSAFPANYVPRKLLQSGVKIMPEDIIRGLPAFVLHYNLEWLFGLILIGVAVGVVLIWQENPGLRRWVRSLPERVRGLGK